jgi:hypothetical protein
MKAKALSNNYGYRLMRAAVAQMVEHLAVNEVVPGSSPGGGVFSAVPADEPSVRTEAAPGG